MPGARTSPNSSKREATQAAAFASSAVALPRPWSASPARNSSSALTHSGFTTHAAGAAGGADAAASGSASSKPSKAARRRRIESIIGNSPARRAWRTGGGSGSRKLAAVPGWSGRRQQAALAGEAHQRLLQLLERPHLDLADTLAADVVDLGELLQSLRLVSQAPLGEDMLLALVQRLHRLKQQFVPHPALLRLGD